MNIPILNSKVSSNKLLYMEPCESTQTKLFLYTKWENQQSIEYESNKILNENYFANIWLQDKNWQILFICCK